MDNEELQGGLFGNLDEDNQKNEPSEPANQEDDVPVAENSGSDDGDTVTHLTM